MLNDQHSDRFPSNLVELAGYHGAWSGKHSRRRACAAERFEVRAEYNRLYSAKEASIAFTLWAMALRRR